MEEQILSEILRFRVPPLAKARVKSKAARLGVPYSDLLRVEIARAFADEPPAGDGQHHGGADDVM